MSEQESEAFLNELRESSMEAETPPIPDLDSEIDVLTFLTQKKRLLEIDEPLEPPESPETVEPTDRQTDQESAAGPERLQVPLEMLLLALTQQAVVAVQMLAQDLHRRLQLLLALLKVCLAIT